MTPRLKIINGKIITPEGILENGCLLVEDHIITDIQSGDIPATGAKIIDAKGQYVSPGFIDIHTHGAGGHDFMDGTVDAFLGAAETHARFGTTSMVPTTLAGKMDELKHTLSVYRQATKQNHNGSEMLGLHLEGPYFSMNQRGAQDPRYIHNPIPEEYKPIVQDYPEIIRWSAAPELAGAITFGQYLSSHGILPSIGHTDAIYEEVLDAFHNGFTHITHLYSCMSGVTRRNAYRYAGVIESAYLIDQMTVEIIADGTHLPASLLQLIFKIKGADHIALVTDSMRAAGMPEGPSILGSLTEGQPVIVEDGVAKLPDRTAFAGSVATTNQLVRNMVRLAGVNLIDAVKMMTATPAKICKVFDKKGSLTMGKQADIVVFDEAITIHATIINGQLIYSK